MSHKFLHHGYFVEMLTVSNAVNASLHLIEDIERHERVHFIKCVCKIQVLFLF